MFRYTLVFVFSACFNSLLSQHYVKLFIDHTANLTEVNTVDIGFVFDTKNGKLKKRGSLFNNLYFNPVRFDLKAHGAIYDEYWRRLILQRDTIEQNNSKVYISYCHPKNKNIVVNDTIFIPRLTSFTMEPCPVNYGIVFKPRFTAYYSNGGEKVLTGQALINFIETNHIDIAVENGQLNNDGSIKIPSFFRKPKQCVCES
ncbi:MAG: hypothetical protein HC896_18490 [Bacteroidales bacterium]|nr:hypothetical protein [Bacteroidales bacterium]